MCEFAKAEFIKAFGIQFDSSKQVFAQTFGHLDSALLLLTVLLGGIPRLCTPFLDETGKLA